MTRNGILLAVREVDERPVRRALGPAYPILVVDSLGPAIRLLRARRFALAVGTVQFDDSSLFDLIPAAKESETPLIALLVLDSSLSDAMVDTSLTAATGAGFAASLNMRKLAGTKGVRHAYRTLRTKVAEIYWTQTTEGANR